MDIVLIGGGGHGRVIIDILEKAGENRIVGILDACLQVGERVLGYDVLGRDNDLRAIAESQRIQGAVAAIGDNARRAEAVRAIKAECPEMLFPNAIHPSAQVARSVRLGVGNVVMAGAVINSSAVVGSFCIFNTNCSVDHDARVGDFASLAPNSCLGGYVEIGEGAAVCLGANVIDRLKIGMHTIVGAGATVLHDLPSGIVAYGTPARIVRACAALDPAECRSSPAVGPRDRCTKEVPAGA
jgi:sugar O-acyltransferase (sialic acid O-acetyltransferase NeuD family)